MENIELLKTFGHKSEDEEQLRFYQVPKVLFHNERYKGLSADAKLAYAILRDRQELSKKNDWKDENGYLYFIYTNENLEDILGYGKSKVIRIKKELEEYNLLINHKVGLGKPNRLYILKPNYEDIDTYKTDGSIDNIKKSEKQTSRSLEIKPAEVLNKDTNDTDISDTEFIDTHSFESERVNEHIDNDELEKILDNAEVKEDYLKDNYYPVKRAIESLYYRNVNLNVNGMSIPPSKIRRDLLELNYFHVDMGIKIFKEQSTQQKIVNRISYLATCIYTSIFDMELKIQNDLIYDGLI